MTRNRTRVSAFMLFGLGISLAACQRGQQDIDVTAKTTYSGVVNGSPFAAQVSATFNTGRGGTSSCTFAQLPPSFNPASLGTMA